MFFVRIKNCIDRLLDAQINNLVAVVRQNYIDEILADVMHVAFDSSEDHRPFGSGAAFLLHEGLEKTHGRFHRFG